MRARAAEWDEDYGEPVPQMCDWLMKHIPLCMKARRVCMNLSDTLASRYMHAYYRSTTIISICNSSQEVQHRS